MHRNTVNNPSFPGLGRLIALFGQGQLELGAFGRFQRALGAGEAAFVHRASRLGESQVRQTKKETCNEETTETTNSHKRLQVLKASSSSSCNSDDYNDTATGEVSLQHMQNTGPCFHYH
jgi:hypothetical protein